MGALFLVHGSFLRLMRSNLQTIPRALPPALTNVEPFHARHFGGLFYSQVTYHGPRWTHAQLGFEILKLMGRAQREHFHAAVVQIARPSAHTEISSHALCEVPVADSLHLTGDIVPPCGT
jgi:hypothetical protein